MIKKNHQTDCQPNAGICPELRKCINLIVSHDDLHVYGPDSMTRSGDNHSANLKAMGLFISTALLSQLLQNELERRRKERTTMALRHMYETKRLSDRLSYTDLTATQNFPRRLPDGMDSLQVRTTDVSGLMSFETVLHTFLSR